MAQYGRPPLRDFLAISHLAGNLQERRQRTIEMDAARHNATYKAVGEHSARSLAAISVAKDLDGNITDVPKYRSNYQTLLGTYDLINNEYDFVKDTIDWDKKTIDVKNHRTDEVRTIPIPSEQDVKAEMGTYYSFKGGAGLGMTAAGFEKFLNDGFRTDINTKKWNEDSWVERVSTYKNEKTGHTIESAPQQNFRGDGSVTKQYRDPKAEGFIDPDKAREMIKKGGYKSVQQRKDVADLERTEAQTLASKAATATSRKRLEQITAQMDSTERKEYQDFLDSRVAKARRQLETDLPYDVYINNNGMAVQVNDMQQEIPYDATAEEMKVLRDLDIERRIREEHPTIKTNVEMDKAVREFKKKAQAKIDTQKKVDKKRAEREFLGKADTTQAGLPVKEIAIQREVEKRRAAGTAPVEAAGGILGVSDVDVPATMKKQKEKKVFEEEVQKRLGLGTR